MTDMTIRDAQVMRAMAHPARIAILEYLGGGAEATATECAEVVGLSPSATSYHLRALARAGLIEDAPSRGDGRERVWRSAARGYRIEPGLQSDDDMHSASLALAQAIITRDDEQTRRWFARAESEPKEWFDAAGIVRRQLVMTSDELVHLFQAIDELMEQYSRPARPEPPPGARSVAAQFRALPAD